MKKEVLCDRNICPGSRKCKVFGVYDYLKTEKLDKKLSKTVKSTYYLREKSDYDHFFVASKEDAEKQLQSASQFILSIEEYLNKNLR